MEFSGCIFCVKTFTCKIVKVFPQLTLNFSLMYYSYFLLHWPRLFLLHLLMLYKLCLEIETGGRNELPLILCTMAACQWNDVSLDKGDHNALLCKIVLQSLKNCSNDIWNAFTIKVWLNVCKPHQKKINNYENHNCNVFKKIKI